MMHETLQGHADELKHCEQKYGPCCSPEWTGQVASQITTWEAEAGKIGYDFL